MSYTDKYQPGAITNSMLEAADSCPFKFRVLYQERAKLLSQYDKILDAMSLGVIVHETVEQFPKQMPITPLQALKQHIADWGLIPEQEYFLANYLKAIDHTLADGRAKGRTYTAPTWTSFWKTNYSGLSRQAEEFNRAMTKPEWFCDIEPMDFLLRAIQCLQNYKDLLPDINAGLSLVAVEQTFHVPFNGETLAGTMDRLDFDLHTEGRVITDFKTGNKAYTAATLHNLNQLHMYALAEQYQGNAVTGFRVVSLERKEIITVPFNRDAHKVYVTERLPRMINWVKTIGAMEKKDLPVLAGRSLAIGCPCALAYLKPEDSNKCPAIYMEVK